MTMANPKATDYKKQLKATVGAAGKMIDTSERVKKLRKDIADQLRLEELAETSNRNGATEPEG